jgi:hypothetical protein
MIIVETRKISRMPYSTVFLLALLVIASSFLIPANYPAYAHTFSTSESAAFLSLVDQIRAETQLVTMNLENNNVTLAQAHAQKAAALPDNDTIGEIRERNNRIADSLAIGLTNLEGNVTSLTSGSQEQIPQDTIQGINESVMSLNDTLAEAVTVRVETAQRNNATMWAMVLADLVNTALSDYGNATGSFDLTNMSNMAEVETNSNTSSMSNTTTNIVDEAAYQSAQYISNNTILQLFTETLKPLTLSANETSSEIGNTTSTGNATVMTQEGQETSAGNLTSNIDELEARLMLLRDNIETKATPQEVMTTAHQNIHPLIMQIYGLTLEQEEGEEHSEHIEP